MSSQQQQQHHHRQESAGSSFQRMSDDDRRYSSSRREEFRDEYQGGSLRSTNPISSSLMMEQQQAGYDNKYGGQHGQYDENGIEEEIYIVRQEYGYLSIFFSTVQGIILALMMWQCGIAPMDINPMVGPYPDALSGK